MLSRESAAALIGGGNREQTPEEKRMAAEPVRVRVISNFYGGGGKVHKLGEVIEVSPNFARELVATGRVVREEAPPTPTAKVVEAAPAVAATEAKKGKS